MSLQEPERLNLTKNGSKFISRIYPRAVLNHQIRRRKAAQTDKLKILSAFYFE